jgi:CRP-like cAMP-binding protein
MRVRNNPMTPLTAVAAGLLAGAVGTVCLDAVMGERALLEGGRRTATLRAVTDCVIATAAKDQIDRGSLSSLAELHHREDPDR